MANSKPVSLGTRLILSYVLLAAVIMAIFTLGTGITLYAEMRAQLARFAVEDIETVEGLLALTPDGRVTVREDYHNHAESKKVVDHYIEVLSPGGRVLYRNNRLGSLALGGSPIANEGVGGYSETWIPLPDGTRVLRVSRRHVVEGSPVLIRLAQSAEPIERALLLFGGAAALMFPLVIAVATLAARRMSNRILAPVQNIAVRAGEITSSCLHERIPVNGTGDEIDRLAEAFNGTLARLDDSFRQLRQFTSDASHELRTPLAAIRAIGEVGLERDGSRQEYRELVGSMLEEVSRLTRLVDDLLMISRGDAGFLQLNLCTIRVLDLVRDTAALLEPLAEEKNQTVELSGDEMAVVDGDPVFLRHALINLIHNAIKYSPRFAVTFVGVERSPHDHVTISVRDAGTGISPEHLPHVFDRFYRVDSGRARLAGGFGLGLAITQWAVAAHKGRIQVASTPGQGSTFEIVLPEAAGSSERIQAQS